MCSPPALNVLVEILPVVPTKATSAVPSWRGGGGGAAACAWARTGRRRIAAKQSARTTDVMRPILARPARPTRRLDADLLVVGRSAARFRDVVLLHLVDVELPGAGGDLVKRLVEVDRSRLHEPRVV